MRRRRLIWGNRVVIMTFTPFVRGFTKTFLVVMAALAGVLLAAPGFAQTFPKLAGHPVVDQAGIIPAPEEAALNAQLLDLQKQTGHQLAVATIGSLEGHDLGAYGYPLGRARGNGGNGEHDGAALLF